MVIPRSTLEKVKNSACMVEWSKNSTSLAVSKKFKFFNADKFIEGIGTDGFSYTPKAALPS